MVTKNLLTSLMTGFVASGVESAEVPQLSYRDALLCHIHAKMNGFPIKVDTVDRIIVFKRIPEIEGEPI